MFRLFLSVMLVAVLFSSSSASAQNGQPPARHHVQASQAKPCKPVAGKSHPRNCGAHKSAVKYHHRHRGGARSGKLHLGVYVSASHLTVQAALLAPAPRVRDMSGYNTGLYVAPAGTPYPLTEPKPGDYICTTKQVPLDTKVVGPHSAKPYPPCGYKWGYMAGSGKEYWYLKPDPNYGVRR